VYEKDLEDILSSFKLDVRIIGDEYKEKTTRVEIIVKKRV
tara:strand:+ start:271 stop:390 length:120 start_codon:yes stop_codon:yes gene_type:complete